MRIYLDANAVIIAVEGSQEISRASRAVLDAAGLHSGALVTSELCLAEVLVGTLQSADRQRTEAHMTFLTDGPRLTVAPVDRATLVGAAELRVRYRSLKLPDAIHLATAVDKGCERFLSGDRRLPEVPGIRRVDLAVEPVSQLLADLRRALLP